MVQRWLASETAAALAARLGTQVEVGRIDLRLPNRLIVDDVLIYDQHHKPMLQAARVAAGIELLPLAEGKIRITSAQLFGAHATLYRANAHAPLNCQFALDSLRSRDTTASTPLDLAIRQLIIRGTSVRYDQQDQPPTPQRFSPYHIAVADLAADITLRELTDSTISVAVRRLSAQEQSGLNLRALTFEATATPSAAHITNLSLALPHTDLTARALHYDKGVKYSGDISGVVDMRDLAPLLTLPYPLGTMAVSVNAQAHGDHDNITAAVNAHTTTSPDLNIAARGNISRDWHGHVALQRLHASQRLLTPIVARLLPEQKSLATTVDGTADITLRGCEHIKGEADIRLADLAHVKGAGEYTRGTVRGAATLQSINLPRLTGDRRLPRLAEATVRGTYIDKVFKGDVAVHDAAAELTASGSVDLGRTKRVEAAVDIVRLTTPYVLPPTHVDMNVAGPTLAALTGAVSLNADYADIAIEAAGADAFSVDAQLRDIGPLRQFADLPLTLDKPVTLRGDINRKELSQLLRAPAAAALATSQIDISAPALTIAGRTLEGTTVSLHDGLATVATTLQGEKNDIALRLGGEWEGDTLHTALTWDRPAFRGTLRADVAFGRQLGARTIDVRLPNSTFAVGDSVWTISSGDIHYGARGLHIDQFLVRGEGQSLRMDGTLSHAPDDSLTAELHDIDLRYVLDLVNFHSVDFDGRASGRFVAHDLFGSFRAGGHLDVNDFLFENGRMGALHADAAFSTATGQIDIDAVCDDPDAKAETFITGYISPVRSDIRLDITARHTRAEFMQSFCSSFMSDAEMYCDGQVCLAGPLSGINLTGELLAAGAFTLMPTGVRYTLPGDTVRFVTDDILLSSAPVRDNRGGMARLTGGIHHHNLGRMSYDLTARAEHFLAYDVPDMDDDTFCGRAVIDGEIGIHGRGGELLVTADATTLPDTYLTYDAAATSAATRQDFITWRSAARDTTHQQSTAATPPLLAADTRTNIHLNFLVHATPDARLHLLMDHATGDDINLFGDGTLRVDYYNKGSLDIFGGYTIESGTYRMTIQNLMRRDFTFRPAGTVMFGGDPFAANLSLAAQYALPSVPLADLNLGSSFAATNVPVSCLMNITGTAGAPRVDFNIDLPSLSTDAQQMVRAVINSEEQMNQQALYLLAIGRFYPDATAAQASEQNPSQGSLAAQSFLSGTLSAQLNTVMNSVIGIRNWTFGANITPGNEGYNNAEYEGLLSGRLFNNRLIFNGQFGYRDNVTTNTQSFVGDFNLQYLLTRRGGVSLKVYNQANDRYFTPTGLNTQGIGIMFQKEWGK